ncbi:hypothetical protein NKS28_13605 [Bacillus sp. 1663tsa1]|uniref:hypothetical protein n=1 Tax=Bacillus sp. 1663tsa1 TaxID=2953804 RepID=UPI00209F447F|nr:hypothetical protein [Bacillus sp. 1663tsa1]MCP1178512.1 hypothetical protein [Bacillus sp. 1663tsa1]
MCKTCSNTGVIHTEIFPGAIKIEGCTCEVAKKQEATQKENWNAWIEKFEGWKRGLLHGQRVG